MRAYEGLSGKPDNIVNGGKWVKENQEGHEVCNFVRCQDGYVYGHVETSRKDIDCQINIENIGAADGAESVDGVDVVWIATDPEGSGRRVVGWYRNATVFRVRQDFGNRPPSAQHRKDKIRNYRICTEVGNETLLYFNDRFKPELKLGKGTGWIGRMNLWFPETKKESEIKEFVRDLRAFIDGYSPAIPKGHSKGRWGNGADPERKVKVENAAIEAVKKYYKKDCIIKSVEDENYGWDLEATPKSGGEKICLEVKGLFSADLKVGVTPNEYRALVAHIKGEKPFYRLCVLTSALSEKPILRIFEYRRKLKTWFEEISGKRVTLDVKILEAAIISL